MLLHYKVNKPAKVIFDYLTDMQQYVSVHPVIYKIEHIEKDHYLVFETLKFGFIPYSFTYPATVMGDEENKVITMRATVMKINKIEMIFRIRSDGGNSSEVEEAITFTSPLPIRSMMSRIFKKQHTQLFKNIDTVVH